MHRIDLPLALALLLLPLTLAAAELPLQRIKLPTGFAIELWARVDNARQMTLGRHDDRGGTLFVGSMHAGKVHALRFDASYRVQQVRIVASGLQRPVGVAYKDAPENSRAFLTRLGDPFRARLVDRDGRAGLEFGVTGVPETFLVGSDGTILAKHSGPLTLEDARALLAKAR